MAFAQNPNLHLLKYPLLQASSEEKLVSALDLECLEFYLSESYLTSLRVLQYQNTQQVSDCAQKLENKMQEDLAKVPLHDFSKKASLEKEQGLMRLLLQVVSDRKHYSPSEIDGQYTKTSNERFVLMPFEIIYLKKMFEEAEKDSRSEGNLSLESVTNELDHIFTKLSFLKFNAPESKSGVSARDEFEKIIECINQVRERFPNTILNAETLRFCDEAMKAIKVKLRDLVKLKDTQIYEAICWGDIELVVQKAEEERRHYNALCCACFMWCPFESILCLALFPITTFTNTVSNKRVMGGTDCSGAPECILLPKVPGLYSIFSPLDSCRNIELAKRERGDIIYKNKPLIQKMTG